MNQASVTVAILTYNREQWVVEAVRSVLAQSFPDLECLVIDDGSSDNTRAVLQDVFDPRLRLLCRPHSGHIAALRQLALDEARGEYLAFLDSDDRWDEDFLAESIALLDADPALIFTFTNVRTLNRQGIIRQAVYEPDQAGSRSFFMDLVTGRLAVYGSSAVVLRTHIGRRLAYDASFRVGDHNFLTRLAHQGPACMLARVLVSIHYHQNNLSSRNQLEDCREMVRTIVECAERKWLSRLMGRRLAAPFLYRLGYLSQRSGGRREAMVAYAKAWLAKPWHLKSLLRLLQILLKPATRRE